MATLRAENPEDVKQLVLPSTKDKTGNDQAYVVMYTGPISVADTLDIKQDMSEMRALVIMLTRRIRDWNFEDDGVKLPITLDNVAKFDLGDLAFLGEQINQDTTALTDNEKKTSLDTLNPKQQETTSQGGNQSL